MTSSVFKITSTPPTSIKLDPGQEGRLSFTVESLAAPDEDHAVMLQALLLVDGGRGKPADWLVVDPPGTRSMPGGKTETVSIIARPTPSSPRGENSIKLVVADRDRPNDVYTDSPSVVCEVSAGARAAISPPRKPPRWLIPVIMGGLMVVGVIALILGAGDEPPRARPGLGEPCGGEPDHACGERLLCVASSRKCLLAGGATCKPAQANLCASGECESKAAVCAIPFGGAVSCTENAACSSGYCKDKLCAPSPCRPGCPSGYYCDIALARCESWGRWGLDKVDSRSLHERFRLR